ncbi:MAG: addiction module protein [Gemmataceae bacterium]|nr:addiction module protein [Gemmataceae bacterium]
MNVETVLRNALALPLEDRAKLVNVLLESLEGSDDELSEIDKAWEEEIRCRLAKLEETKQ